MSFTFLIITYRRPQKVARLLRQFLDPKWDEIRSLGVEIVVADDHSEDETRDLLSPLLTELQQVGWHVKYVYRGENIRGDMNLCRGYLQDSTGRYVWFICDDDVVDVPNAVRFLSEVLTRDPLVAICGFLQGANSEYGNKLGSDVRLITDFPEAVPYVYQYPKTTAYLMRRLPEDVYLPLAERWNGTLYSWVGLAIAALGVSGNGSLLLYPPVTARADDEYGLLRYSYRVFAGLHAVVHQALEFAGYKTIAAREKIAGITSNDPLRLCLSGLQAHYDFRSQIAYMPEILAEEQLYLRRNLWRVFLKPCRIIPFLKFLVRYLEAHARNF